MTSIARLALVVLIVMMVVVVIVEFRNISVDEIINYTPDNLILAAVVIIGMFAFKSITLVFPIVVLELASGVIFPVHVAILVNIIGSMVAVTIPYFIGRFEGPRLAQMISDRTPKLKKLAQMQHRGGLFYPYILRTLGMLPLDAVSLFLGAVGVKYPAYLLGSMLGMLPGILAVTIMGSSITTPGSPAFIISCLVSVSTSMASVIIYRRHVRENGQKEDESF